MPKSEPVDILLIHDRWATRQILDACGTIDNDAFHRTFEMGVGSLHDTMVHVLGATRGWTDMLNGKMLPGQQPRPRLESEGDRSPAELITLHEIVTNEFEQAVRAGSLDDTITGERGGTSYSFKRGAILTHVTTHAMHHRAQCLNMLRQIGLEPLPPSSVMEWTLIADTE